MRDLQKHLTKKPPQKKMPMAGLLSWCSVPQPISVGIPIYHFKTTPSMYRFWAIYKSLASFKAIFGWIPLLATIWGDLG